MPLADRLYRIRCQRWGEFTLAILAVKFIWWHLGGVDHAFRKLRLAVRQIENSTGLAHRLRSPAHR